MKRTAGRPSSHALLPESGQESERAVVVTVWWHCLAVATLHPTDLLLWCVPRQELNLNMPRGREKHYNLTYNLVCLCVVASPPSNWAPPLCNCKSVELPGLPRIGLAAPDEAAVAEGDPG